MKTEKDGKTLCYREATLKDESDVIGVTLFGKAGDDINDKNTYSLQNIRISKYKCQRLLKTTDSSKLEQCNLDIESIDTSDLDSTKQVVTSKIVFLDLKSLENMITCANCKSAIQEILPQDDDLVVCEACDNMLLKSECPITLNVHFVLRQDDKTKHNLSVSMDLLKQCFALDDEMDKRQIAIKVFKRKVTVKFNTADTNVDEINLN